MQKFSNTNFDNKKVIFDIMVPQNITDYSFLDFEKDVIKAKKAGATHITISQLEKSRWIWEKDMNDPYPNWGMLLLSLFKVIIPDELKSYLPQDYADRNLQTLKERMRILKKYNLKAALNLCEPFYLPESVYRDRPDWRGPRCDHPRRAVNYYYSPCIDNPEVLHVYKKTMCELLNHIDVDYIMIYTNDSGGGLCWSTGLYSGKNGPSWCKNRSAADRIIGFLDMLIKGAKDAGKDPDIEINSNIGFKENEHTMDSIWPNLKDNMSVNNKTNKGIPMTSHVDTGYEYSISPVKNIPLTISFLDKLGAAYKNNTKNIRLVIPSSDNDEYFLIAEEFKKNPADNLFDRVGILRKVTENIFGDDAADDILDVYSYIDKALIHFADTNIEGLVLCSVNQRWLNRPFVLFPNELTQDQKDYYRPFLFQANDENQANDLLNLQCTSFIRGYYAVFLASKALSRAIENNKKAINILSMHGLKSQEIAVAEKLNLTADRLKLLNCFFKNAIHAMKFQDIIDNADYEAVPEISPKWPIDAQPELLEYESLIRAEIDNTYEIIKLIRGRERKMLITALEHELEDIFMFSPNIVSQLEKKINIMLDCQLDGKRLFVTNNK